MVAEAELGVPCPPAGGLAPTLAVNGIEAEPTEKQESCWLFEGPTKATLVQRHLVEIKIPQQTCFLEERDHVAAGWLLP